MLSSYDFSFQNIALLKWCNLKNIVRAVTIICTKMLLVCYVNLASSAFNAVRNISLKMSPLNSKFILIYIDFEILFGNYKPI